MSFSAEEFDNHRFEKVVSVNSDLKRKSVRPLHL
jgi:hypothetical protein